MQRPGGCDSTQEALQDVDDWDLTELNPDWEAGESGDNVSSVGESGDDVPSPLPPLVNRSMFDLLILKCWQTSADPKYIPLMFLSPTFP